nr:MAG TPA: hypothetical protein [Caudoviricetes sp.]
MPIFINYFILSINFHFLLTLAKTLCIPRRKTCK